MAREYRLISSDGHLEVPPERWTPRVPKQYQDRVPRTVRLPDGGDGLLIEGLPVQAANFLFNCFEKTRFSFHCLPYGRSVKASS